MLRSCQRARHREGCWYLATIFFQAAGPLGPSAGFKSGMVPVWFEEEAGIINCVVAFYPDGKDAL